MKVCLFFTYGMSLKAWDETGLFDREVAIYQELHKRGIEIAFFTYGDKRDLLYQEKLPGIKIIPAYLNIKKASNKFIAILQTFLFPFIFKKEFCAYDLYKTNQMLGAWVPLLTKILYKKKILARGGYEYYQFLILQNKALYKKMAAYLLSKLVYGMADHILLTSHGMADFIKKTFQVSSKKITVYSNYVNTDQFFINKNEPNKKYNRLLFVGRLTEQKNIPMLLDAVSVAKIPLDIIGQGPLEDELKEKARKLNLDINFLGICSNNELASRFRQYEIFILPSLFEGNPKTLLEAMSCGLAVIGTNVEGIREVIRDGYNGILCEPTVEAIANSINQLKNNSELKNKLGHQAREHILQNCSLNSVVKLEYDLLVTVSFLGHAAKKAWFKS